jgi:hypothetical protein
VWLERCISLTLALLYTKHLTNGDRWKEGHAVIDTLVSDSIYKYVFPRPSSRVWRDCPCCADQPHSLHEGAVFPEQHTIYLSPYHHHHHHHFTHTHTHLNCLPSCSPRTHRQMPHLMARGIRANVILCLSLPSFRFRGGRGGQNNWLITLSWMARTVFWFILLLNAWWIQIHSTRRRPSC